MFYWLMKSVVLGPVLRMLFRPWVEGAENIPAHGGYAALTPKVAATRRRAARLNPAPGRLCPSCNTVLPSSGQCDNCG